MAINYKYWLKNIKVSFRLIVATKTAQHWFQMLVNTHGLTVYNPLNEEYVPPLELPEHYGFMRYIDEFTKVGLMFWILINFTKESQITWFHISSSSSFSGCYRIRPPPPPCYPPPPPPSGNICWYVLPSTLISPEVGSVMHCDAILTGGLCLQQSGYIDASVFHVGLPRFLNTLVFDLWY